MSGIFASFPWGMAILSGLMVALLFVLFILQCLESAGNDTDEESNDE